MPGRERFVAGHDELDPAHADAARRPDVPTLLGLQQSAGNRAVTQFVQREPFGTRPAESPYQLHLDPEIEAQIRAINAMNAMIAPHHVQAGLLNLNLPPMPPAIAPAAAPQLPAPSAPATAVGPAPGTGLMGPRAGTGGDIWQAV